MPTPPYAELRVSVNAAVPQTGAVTILNGDTLEFSYTSTVDWSTHTLEIYDFPEGWAGPGAPWTTVLVPQADGTNATVYRYTGGTTAPPTFAAPAAPLWGKIMPQLVVNGGIKNGAVSAELTDDLTALSILSPTGFPGIAWREGRQFGGHKKWVKDLQDTLISLDSTAASILQSPWKVSVVAMTTANVALTGAPAAGDTDNVTVGDGERLLVGMAQTAGDERGVYVVDHGGAWVRSLDADSETDILGLTVLVRGGTVNAGRIYQCANNVPIVVDATTLTFSRMPDRGATASPTANSYPLRDGAGDCAFNSVELNAGGELRFDVSGTDVTAVKVDASKNVEIGDAVDGESVTILAATNKSVAAVASGTGTVALTASGAASAVSLSTNGTEVLHAEAGVLSFNGQPLTDAGGLEIVSPGEVHFDVSGTDVSAIAVDGSKNVIVGDSTDGESVLIHAATNKSTQMRASGAGITQLAAIGASSKISLTAGGTEVIAAQNAGLSLFGSTYSTTGIQLPNTVDGTIIVDSVAAGNGKNLLLYGGDVTAGVGSGGSIAFTPGVNVGGSTGNVVCVMPFGSGGTSGMFKLNDGTNVFLDAYATAALTTFAFDRATTFSAGNAFTINAGTGGTGGIVLQRNGTTRIEIDGTGLGFFGVTPVAQQADIGALTDNSAGTANNTIEALPDPADAPATADALRDDLVANLIPALRNNFADLAEQVNAIRAVLQNLGLMA